MKIPLSRALIYIFLSVIAISGPAVLGVLYYQSLMQQRSEDPHFFVRNLMIVSQKLPFDYICELLDLSYDCPTNLYRLNVKELEKKLLSSPLIKEAKVRKIPPDTLWIDYKIKEPIALSGDFENRVIDHTGSIFPYQPFFKKSNLPAYYLGDVNYQLALNIQKSLEGYHLLYIDISKVNELSLGKREIIVALNWEGREVLLRLTPENYQEELTCLPKILKRMKAVKTIDLRLPQQALITN